MRKQSHVLACLLAFILFPDAFFSFSAALIMSSEHLAVKWLDATAGNKAKRKVEQKKQRSGSEPNHLMVALFKLK